ncbi:hypothetical protein V8C86DRAFT_2476727, partial [Haematococcus lacustris]
VSGRSWQSLLQWALLAWLPSLPLGCPAATAWWRAGAASCCIECAISSASPPQAWRGCRTTQGCMGVGRSPTAISSCCRVDSMLPSACRPRLSGC